MEVVENSLVMADKITPQDRWQRNNGIIAKSYKLKRSLVDEFKKACDSQGVSQASAISEFMNNFIESNKIQSAE